jgi:hypothetical protein
MLLSMKWVKKIRKYWKTAKITATRAAAVGGLPCAGQGCHLRPGAIKSTAERQLTTNWARVIRKNTRELHFLMKPNKHASTSLSVQTPDKHCTFLMQTSQNCVRVQVSTISNVHHIKHYAFPMQNHQNCVHHASVHHIGSLHFSYTKSPKLRPHPNVHHIKTLHFSYTKSPKLRPSCKCPPYRNTTLFLHKVTETASSPKCPPYQNTTLFLRKIAKTASLHKCPPFISDHYTFPIHNHRNFVHHASVHHIKTLHFSYAKSPKLRPHTNVHHIRTLHIPTQITKFASLHKCPPYQNTTNPYANMSKLRPCTTVHYVNHYTFPMQTSQKCVHQTNHRPFTMQTSVYRFNTTPFSSK